MMESVVKESRPKPGWIGSPIFWDRLPEFQRLGSVFLLVGGLVFVAALYFVAPEQFGTARGISPLVLALMASFALLLLARGQARAATWFMVIGAWLYVTAVALFTGGLSANTVMLYPLIIMMAGWRLGPRFAYVFAGLSVAASMGFYLAEVMGILPTAPPNPPALPLIVDVLVYLFSAVLIVSLIRSYCDRLEEVGKLSDDLAQRTAALQAREADLNRAQSVAHVGSWIYDIAADVFYLSAETCRIFGVPEGTRGGREDFLERVHREDQAVVARFWQVAFAGRKPFSIEHRIVVGHELRWVAQVAEIECASDGRPLRGVGTTQDITARKRIEHRLSMAIDATKVVLWELDFRTGSIVFDRAQLLELELEPDESLESLQGWLQRIHPDDLGRFIECFQLAMQPGMPIFEVEYRMKNPDGQYQWIHTRGSVVQRSKEGQAEIAVGTSMNVSARKQVDEAVKVSEERSRNLASMLRLMCDNVPDMIWAKDLDKRYLFANKAICEQLLKATDTDEPLGKTDMFFARRERDSRPDDAQWHTFGELCQDSDAITLQRGEPSVFEEFGNIRGSLVYLDVHKVPFRNEQGEVIGTVGSARDITERKQTEAELARHRHHLEDLVQRRTAELTATEARASRILESSADGLYGVDGYGIITFINPAACKLLGYSSGEAIGRAAHALFHHSKPDGSPYPEEECPACNAVRTGQEVRVDDENYWHADGHAVPVMYAVHPAVEGGQNLGAVVSFVDVGAQRATAHAREQALIAAENLARARSEFLANMSHEIRTPLNGVLGFANIGYRSYQDSEKARNAFEKILASGDRLLAVVDEVLDFSKIEAGQMRVDAIKMSLLGTIDRVIEIVAERARAKGLELRLETAADLPLTCVSDPLRLGQVLLNLLSNAIKFTEAGSVTLSVSYQDAELVFRVTDTGIGISEDQLHFIFDPFRQADGSTSRRFGGTGLGLAISKRVLELMNGAISVESRPGVGSRFEVRLPYVQPAASADEVVASQAGNTKKADKLLAGISILVAEDDAVNQLVLEEILIEDGARAVMVGNGREAVERVLGDGAETYDIVLMDIQMPVMNGYEAAQRIMELAPDLPIIGQTAHAFAEDRDRCLAAGMVAHIAKPIDPQALVELVLQIVAARRHR